MTEPANPLIASRVDTTNWFSGVGIAETVDMLIGGVKNGSWVDGALGGVGTVAETAVWVLDPVGALVTAGFGWVVEHVQPLSDALDWLAGDPDQVAANAQTWRNVGIQHADVVDLYARAVRNQITDWDGPAATAYRTHARQSTELNLGLAKASEGMAVIVQMTGSLVSLVRTLVRDLIGELVSILVARIPLWSIEAVGTLGIATPYVEAQVTALVAKWGARITRLLKALATSLRNLMPAVRKLDEIIETIASLLRHRPGTAALGVTPAVSDRQLIGAGGSWRVFDEQPGGAVGQLNDLSCVSACGEMLSGRSQIDFVDALGSPSNAQALARELGEGWRGGQVGHIPDILKILDTCYPWGAELYEGGRMGHMVIVDGIRADGKIVIRDPWNGGSTYAMEVEEFQRVWNGNAAFKP